MKRILNAIKRAPGSRLALAAVGYHLAAAGVILGSALGHSMWGINLAGLVTVAGAVCAAVWERRREGGPVMDLAGFLWLVMGFADGLLVTLLLKLALA